MLKKSKLVIASIFAMFAMALPACNSNTNPKEQHTHTYSEEWSKDATYHWHAATCEHTDEVISIPDSVTTIEESAFERCTSLASITLGNGLVTIGDYAFISCPFETISIPSSVTSIGSGAFYFCSSLASIYFDGTVDQFNALGSASNFFSQVPATFVRCSNGVVNIA